MTPADAALDALGHPTRRRIVRALGAGPLAVGALARQVPVSRPAVSQHLRVLEGARLVTATRRGRERLFRLDDQGLGAARAWLDDLWAEALPTFAALAESTYVGRPEGKPR